MTMKGRWIGGLVAAGLVSAPSADPRASVAPTPVPPAQSSYLEWRDPDVRLAAQADNGAAPIDSGAETRGASQTHRTTAPTVRDRLDATLAIFVVSRPLGAVLAEVAQLSGFKLRLNDRVDDVVAQRRLTGTTRQVLDELATLHNLTWFVERDLVDVSKADTAAVKTFQIGRVPDRQIRDAMAKYGLVNADRAIEVDERHGVARVFAPPRLTARLESIIVGLRAPDAPSGTIEVIRFGQRERPAAP